VDAFLRAREQFIAQNRNIVSVDETSFGRNSYDHVMGYAPKGQPLYVAKRRARETTTSVAACVSASGLVAMHTLVGASFNTDMFLCFLQSLDLPSGSVVLLDNVRFHHALRIKNFAAERGLELLYVPPYSPWFNPIEFCFSVVKKAYARVQDIREAFASLLPSHCHAFFRKSLGASGPPAPIVI
jgi:transposase